MANKKLMVRALRAIESNPEQFNQSAWRCEAGMCFAGWVCHVARGKWLGSAEDEIYAAALIANSRDDSDSIMEMFGPRPNRSDCVMVRDRAKRLLQITDDQAGRLFAADNSLTDLRRMVGRFR